MNKFINLIETCINAADFIRRKNPKMTIFCSMMFLIYLYKKFKSMTKRPKSLKNRVVLVTGGVSGIGRLVALLCKLKGSIVIVWDINDSGIREMEELVDLSMKVDITSAIQVESSAKHVFERFGHVDILINNAGIVSGKPFLQLNKRQITKCFEVNVISHFWTVQAFLPKMIERKSGHIVTISSCAAIQGVPKLVDYGASKAACRSFHDTLNLELHQQGIKDGISMSCINPYFINTGMFNGTVTTKWWILRKFCGFDFLQPEYVANQIIDAIEYEKEEVFLPDIMRVGWLLRYSMMPEWLATSLVTTSGCVINTH